MINYEKLVSSICDPYTLMGTSICKDESCITCLSGLKCGMKKLCLEIANVSVSLSKPIEEIFPTLNFVIFLIFDKENK